MGSLFLYRSIGSAKDHKRFLDLDILAHICCVLHCTVGDLLEYHR